MKRHRQCFEITHFQNNIKYLFNFLYFSSTFPLTFSTFLCFWVFFFFTFFYFTSTYAIKTASFIYLFCCYLYSPFIIHRRNFNFKKILITFFFQNNRKNRAIPEFEIIFAFRKFFLFI